MLLELANLGVQYGSVKALHGRSTKPASPLCWWSRTPAPPCGSPIGAM